MKNKTFSVIEYHSFFAIRHNETGQERNMSDGVDVLTDMATGKSIQPGSENFIKFWEDSLNANVDETMEAYFPNN
jgi:hypothetical protein